MMITRNLETNQNIQDMFRQRDVAFPITFEALAKVGLWELEEETNDPLAFISKT